MDGPSCFNFISNFVTFRSATYLFSSVSRIDLLLSLVRECRIKYRAYKCCDRLMCFRECNEEKLIIKGEKEKSWKALNYRKHPWVSNLLFIYYFLYIYLLYLFTLFYIFIYCLYYIYLLFFIYYSHTRIYFRLFRWFNQELKIFIHGIFTHLIRAYIWDK